MLTRLDFKIDKELVDLLRLREEWPLISTRKMWKPSIYITPVNGKFEGIVLMYFVGTYILRSETVLFDDDLNCYQMDDNNYKCFFDVIKTLKKDLKKNIMEYGFEYTRDDFE